jgi:Flp pilus assembly pilin Flp
MKTTGAGAVTFTVILSIIAFALLAKLTGMDSFLIWAYHDASQALRTATGWHPSELFRNVSLASEGRTYLEVLASNNYLQMYFVAGGVCALLASVFVARADAKPLWRFQPFFVAFLILLLLPVALTTVTYGEIFAARSISYICLAVLILLGLGACYEVLRVKTKGASSKLAQGFVLLVVAAYGVVVPAYYGLNFMWSA